jgi:cytochrome P450
VQTLAALLSFVYALALHPEAQAKGQAELDVVVGRDRLPDFSDRKSLPFVRALISESLRWQSVAPVG